MSPFPFPVTEKIFGFGFHHACVAAPRKIDAEDAGMKHQDLSFFDNKRACLPRAIIYFAYGSTSRSKCSNKMSFMQQKIVLNIYFVVQKKYFVQQIQKCFVLWINVWCSGCYSEEMCCILEEFFHPLSFHDEHLSAAKHHSLIFSMFGGSKLASFSRHKEL